MLPSADQNEILRRRTFAIISHPDAGKTTLTEKLLLYGGAIHVAGAVKSNKIRKTATSDWMEIEKQRGISVATSVMGFDYDSYHINILDTPGHQDFAEDTFRTLTAVDSAIVVIDSAKGVETQTRRLMEVCRMRKTPVMVFMNKMDREGKDPFDLIDEAEKELGIHCTPVTWANGQGLKFESVFALNNRPAELSAKLQEDLEMIDGVSWRFGSGILRFGIQNHRSAGVVGFLCQKRSLTQTGHGGGERSGTDGGQIHCVLL